jgi:tRNA pseudouridine55 synthase
MKNYHGLLVLDKPTGLTSRAALDRAMIWFPQGTRFGQTGTLDPLATGVLVVCLGVATRLAEYVQDMDKVYQAGILFGASSNTDDADGKVTPVEGLVPPLQEEVARALDSFVGDIQQIPPIYSAAKVTGRRAYELARKGKEVSLAARKVRIYSVKLLKYQYPHLEVEVCCGKGTYIRSLARDLGQKLGCGGLIASLRRLRVGPFAVEQAVALDIGADEARQRVLPVSWAVSQLPRVDLSEAQIQQLRWGRALEWKGPNLLEEGAGFLGEELVGIVECREGKLFAKRMLNIGKVE